MVIYVYWYIYHNNSVLINKAQCYFSTYEQFAFVYYTRSVYLFLCLFIKHYASTELRCRCTLQEQIRMSRRRKKNEYGPPYCTTSFTAWHTTQGSRWINKSKNCIFIPLSDMYYTVPMKCMNLVFLGGDTTQSRAERKKSKVEKWWNGIRRANGGVLVIRKR